MKYIFFLILIIALPLRSHEFFRNNKAIHLIIFVHGLAGDAKSTWTNADTSFYWPKEFAVDPVNKSFDVLVFDYNSKCNNVLPDEAADQLLTRIQEYSDKYFYKSISFVAHSLGGIVVREFILNNRKNFKTPISDIFLLGTPNLGDWKSSFLNLMLCNGGHINTLSRGRGSYLDKLNDEWRLKFEQRDSQKDFNFYAAFELVPLVTHRIVEKESAVLYSQQTRAFDVDHIDLSKPTGSTSLIYLWVRQSLISNLPPARKISFGYEQRSYALFDLSEKVLTDKEYKNFLVRYKDRKINKSTWIRSIKNEELKYFALGVMSERSENYKEAYYYYSRLNNVTNNLIYQKGLLEMSAAASVLESLPGDLAVGNLGGLDSGQQTKLKKLINDNYKEWSAYRDYYLKNVGPNLNNPKPSIDIK